MDIQNPKIEIEYGEENLKLIFSEVLKQEFMKILDEKQVN